jgi:nitrate/nitrite transporter NarK
VVALSLTLRCVPESRDEEAGRRLDASGAALSVLGLGALSYALIEARTVPVVVVAVAAGTGLAALAVFLLRERRHPNPVLPLHLFASRAFSVSNAMTLLVYGALGAMLFFLVLQLQESLGFSPLRAGLATVPLPLTMLVLSSRSGALAQRIGPRPQLTAGPIASAVGAFMLSGVGPDSEYVADVLPGLVVFSLGLVTLVAPVTATVLAAAPQRFAGTASGVNNAVARTGSLLAVAGLPALVGLTGGDYTETGAMTAGYADALRIAGVVLLGGGLLGYLGLRGVPRPGGGSDRPSTTGRTQE